MRIRLLRAWEALRTNFWFVPLTMVLGAALLSLVAIRIDRLVGEHNWVAALGWTYTRGPEGSRAVLATIAGSMATIAGVIFSVTVVALQLASTQFGPRLLRNFVRDPGNQVALGTFIATFTYCLLVLRTVNGTDDQLFVPHLAVTVGLLLSLASLGVLIYFIHHTATAIQAENVIASVGHDLDSGIDRLFPEELGHAPPHAEAGRVGIPPGFEAESRPVRAASSDYIQAVDEQKLMRIARDHDLVVRLEHRPGRFIVEGTCLARVWPGDRLDESLAEDVRDAFTLGHRRSLAQDVEFAIDQFVEVAVRALSPGVNDPFTAMNCLDRLGAALCRLARREFPSDFRQDDEGRLRVVTVSVTPAILVDAAFDQIRHAARDDGTVTLRLLDTLSAIAEQATSGPFRAAIRRHVELARHVPLAEPYPAEVERRLARIVAQLERPAAADPGEQEAASWAGGSGS